MASDPRARNGSIAELSQRELTTRVNEYFGA